MLAHDTLEHEIRGATRRVEVIKPCVRKVFCNVLETSRGKGARLSIAYQKYQIKTGLDDWAR